jgi:predicted DNA-binding protein
VETQLNVQLPSDLYERLEMKAKAAGVPIEQYVINELARLAAMPTREEMMERLRKLPRVTTTRDPVDVIREARDGGRNTWQP